MGGASGHHSQRVKPVNGTLGPLGGVQCPHSNEDKIRAKYLGLSVGVKALLAVGHNCRVYAPS